MIHLDFSLFKDNYVADWHEHVWLNQQNGLDVERCDGLVDAANRFGVDTLVCSLPIIKHPAPDEYKNGNRAVYSAMQRYPEKIRGMCFVNPECTEEAVAEIKHCIKELKMVGVKLYHQFFISDPVQNPIIEACIELDAPILVHAGKLKYMPESEPFISDGTHFAEIARRYPEANIIMAHIGGGGDWQWSLKAIADFPNIAIDMSGSVVDEGIIEESVRYLGAERVLFGTDLSWSACIGKMLEANISLKDKMTILGNNKYKKFLERGLSK